MKERILNITKSIVGLCLVASILMPTLVKFSHAFNHHEHEVCAGDYNTHFHALDLDCEFFKFKINKPFSFTTQTLELTSFTKIKKEVSEYYSYHYQSNIVYYSKRGPPSLIV